MTKNKKAKTQNKFDKLVKQFDGSYWNTRIIKHHVDGKYENGKEYHEVWYGIHEVYYDKKERPFMYTENPIRFSFQDKNDFAYELGHIIDASQKTILEEIENEDFLKDTKLMLDDLR